MNQKPDKWVVLKITAKGEEPIYKVFATWLGGYLDGDAWKMNSGIKKVEKKEDYFLFYGVSGSCYECAPVEHTYGTNYYTQGVLDNIINKGLELGHIVEVMPPDTDFLTISYSEDE